MCPRADPGGVKSLWARPRATLACWTLLTRKATRVCVACQALDRHQRANPLSLKGIFATSLSLRNGPSRLCSRSGNLRPLLWRQLRRPRPPALLPAESPQGDRVLVLLRRLLLRLLSGRFPNDLQGALTEIGGPLDA